jgi:Protein of unknown function (DUF2894)
VSTVRDALGHALADALARRASAQQGEVRRLIDTRLAALPARPEAPPAEAGATAPRGAAAAPGPLAALLAEHAQRARPAAAGAALAASPAVTPAPDATEAGEPQALAWFRDTWSRLSTSQRLAQSQARLPGNAGPLNAEHLAHRALLVMNEASPDCLRHFMAHLDTLFWLDGVNRG